MFDMLNLCPEMYSISIAVSAVKEINNFIAYYGVTYIRGLTVIIYPCPNPKPVN